MSSCYQVDVNTYSIMSRNCIVHKVAFSNQDAICHGFHDRIIQKALEGKINPEVHLKECIARGDNYSRHIINWKPNQTQLPDYDYLNKKAEVRDEPEIKGGLKTLRDRGIKIMNYEEHIPK